MKRILLVLILVSLLVLIPGCSESQETLTDLEGNEVPLPDKVERIISTAPSNSEILLALGQGSKIVATDNYTDEHEDLNPDRVLLDFKSPDAETIISLEPDIIIASGHNKTGSDDPLALIKEAGIAVVYIPSATDIQGVYDAIEFCAAIVGEEDEGQQMIDELRNEVLEIQDIAATIEDKRTVYLEIAPAPGIYTAANGTFQHELLELVGAVNIFGDEEGWLTPSEEVIINANPDVIITNVEYIPDADLEILNREGWADMQAIQGEKVYLIDANASSRPSQNVILAIRQIAEKIYPEYYSYE
jgi:iron complex transport system substrate-binding protein